MVCYRLKIMSVQHKYIAKLHRKLTHFLLNQASNGPKKIVEIKICFKTMEKLFDEKYWKLLELQI